VQQGYFKGYKDLLSFQVNSETPDTVLTLEDAKDCRTTPSGTASPVPSLTRSIRGHAQPSSSPGWKSVGAIQVCNYTITKFSIGGD